MFTISRKLNQIRRVFFNKEEKKFIKFNNFDNNKKSDNIVLVELKENYYGLIHLYFLLKKKEFKNSKIVGIWIHPVKRNKGLRGFFAFLLDYIMDYFTKLKWNKIYRILGVNQSIDVNRNFRDNFFIKKSSFVSKNLKIKNKKEVLDINLKGIRVGDLIYDQYLRFYGKSTFDVKDVFTFQRLLTYFENTYKYINNYYLKNKINIKYYIPQNAVYIQGLIVRFFVNKNIKTIGGTNSNKYVKKFTKNDYFHTTKCEDIKRKFEKLDNKKKKIRLSKEQLKKKFSGKITTELNYVRKSSYNKNKFYNLKKRFDVIIFLPNFSDAPHNYGDLVFNDFSEWIYETLNFLKSKNLSVAIKEHPNAWVYSSNKFVENLKIKYKDFIWINKDISNKAIFKKKPLFGISPYGTVLHEMAYHKIIPIATGRNPYMSYDFVFTPKNKKNFFSLINQAIKKKLKFKKNLMNKVAESYYMFFLHDDDYIKNYSREVNLKQFLPAAGIDGATILKKFNEGYFKK